MGAWLVIKKADGQAMLGGECALGDYTLALPRMGMPSLSGKLRFARCLDGEWEGGEYVEANGMRFFLSGVPSSKKSNTDERYEHDLEFVPEIDILTRVYFYDAVANGEGDYKPISDSTSFKFYGTMAEFIGRLNCALAYMGLGRYNVEAGGYEGYDWEKCVEVSFEDKYIWEAIQEGSKAYEIPFEVRGSRIVFGAEPRVVGRAFAYGRDNELLKVEKSNKGDRIANLATARGSSENIPYYYPNDTEYGVVSVVVGEENTVITDADMLAITNIQSLTGRLRAGNERSEVAELVWDSQAMCDVEREWLIRDSQYNGPWEAMVVGESATLEEEPNLNNNKRLVPVLVHFTPQKAGRFDFGMKMFINGALVDMVQDRRLQFLRCIASDGSVLEVEGPPADGDVFRELTIEASEEKVGKRCTLELMMLLPNDGPLVLAAAEIAFPSHTGDGWYWRVGEKRYYSLAQLGLSWSGPAPSREMAGDKIWWVSSDRMPFMTSLTVPKYRHTLGAERFYPAINGDYGAYEAAYEAEGGGKYQFPHPWSPDKPSQIIYVDESEKPGIKGISNTSGQLFGEFAAVAFDEHDNDIVKEGEEGSTTAVYEHSFFYAKLHRLDYVDDETGEDYSLDLFGMASQQGPMTIQMVSGRCAGCKFKVQATEKPYADADGRERYGNPVQASESGELRDGDVGEKVDASNLQPWQQRSDQGEIWVALQKEAETFGVLMPNRGNSYLPEEGDKFNIININLPKCYILAAEKRLERSMMKDLREQNEEKWTFSIALSRIFAAENPSVISELDEYSLVDIDYDGQLWRQYVTTVTYEVKANEALPEIKIDLSDEIGAWAGSYSHSSSSGGAGLTVKPVGGGIEVKPIGSVLRPTGSWTLGGWGSSESEKVDKAAYADEAGHATSAASLDDDSELRRQFLSRVEPDHAERRIVFDEGAHFGTFRSGLYSGTGGRIDSRGNAEVESLRVRSYLEVLELIINRLSAVEGDQLHTECGTIESVEVIGENRYLCRIKRRYEGDFTAFREGMVLKGIVNNLAATALGSTGAQAGAAAMYTSWMRVNMVNAAANSIEVSLYPDSDVPSGRNFPPCELMALARWGHQALDSGFNDSILVSTSERRIQFLRDVVKPILDSTSNYGVTIGKLPDWLLGELLRDGYAVNGEDDYVFAKGVIAESLIQYRQGQRPRPEYVDMGEWQPGCDPRCMRKEGSAYYTDRYWRLGCLWECAKDGTEAEPKWNSTDWLQRQGDSRFSVRFAEPEQLYSADNFRGTLTIEAFIGTMDVTDDVDDSGVEWTRYTEYKDGTQRVASDLLWAQRRGGSGKRLAFDISDVDVDSQGWPAVLTFTAKVTLADGMAEQASFSYPL